MLLLRRLKYEKEIAQRITALETEVAKVARAAIKAAQFAEPGEYMEWGRIWPVVDIRFSYGLHVTVHLRGSQGVRFKAFVVPKVRLPSQDIAQAQKQATLGVLQEYVQGVLRAHKFDIPMRGYVHQHVIWVVADLREPDATKISTTRR